MKFVFLVATALLVARVTAILEANEPKVIRRTYLSGSETTAGNESVDVADSEMAETVLSDNSAPLSIAKGVRKTEDFSVDGKVGKEGKEAGVKDVAKAGKDGDGKGKAPVLSALEARQKENQHTLGAATGLLVGIALVVGIANKKFGAKESEYEIPGEDTDEAAAQVTDTLLGNHPIMHNYGSDQQVTVADAILSKHSTYGSDEQVV